MVAPIPTASDQPPIGGFAVLDDRGRLSVPKPVREAIGIGPGSAVAILVVDGRLVIIPQDRELAQLMDEAAATLERADLSVETLLERLPALRGEVVRRLYGDALTEAAANQPGQATARRGA